jgi:hypothetical protein
MEDDISCNFGVSVDGGEREREREREKGYEGFAGSTSSDVLLILKFCV